MSYSIEQHLTKINKGEKGDNTPEYIIVHFVGASGQAMDNAIYFEKVYRGASGHYFVDPKTIIQVVEDDTPAWHVGDGSRTGQGDSNGYLFPGGATNTNAIGIEMCQDPSTGIDAWHWDFHPDTVKRTEWLIRLLQVQHNIDDDHVIRHYDASGKICPGNWQYNNWQKWWELKSHLEMDIIQPSPSAVPKPEGKNPRLEGVMYLVEPGDTLYSIARRRDVKVSDLIAWNQLDRPDLIFPETKLFIKDPKPTVVKINEKTIEQLAIEVLRGVHGSGRERMISLGNKYVQVQKEVNRRIKLNIK